MNGKSIHPRKALLIAGGLTAFTLVGLGALAGQLSSGAAASTAATSAVETVAPIADTAGSAANGDFAAREAQYQALIQEANRRIETANRQLAEMEQQLAAAQTAAGATANIMAQAALTQSVTTEATISTQRALEIAQASAPGAVAQRTPELVTFEGALAYEVTFDTGTVYVDAGSGAVLYNGTQATAGPTRYEDDDDKDHEREDKDYEGEKREDKDHEEDHEKETREDKHYERDGDWNENHNNEAHGEKDHDD